MIFKVIPRAFINGKEIKTGHNTILSAGFEVIGRRLLDPSFATQMLWLRYDITTLGNQKFAGTFTEISDTQFELSYSYTITLAAADVWTAMYAMTADSLSDTYKGMQRISLGQTVNNGDTLVAKFEFYPAVNNWTSTGRKAWGHRVLNSANTYSPVSHISFYNGATEQKRYALTYSKVSNTKHRVSFTQDQTIACDSTRLYDASSGGNILLNNSGSRALNNLNQHILEMELSQ